jgi:hypothetical protein
MLVSRINLHMPEAGSVRPGIVFFSLFDVLTSIPQLMLYLSLLFVVMKIDSTAKMQRRTGMQQAIRRQFSHEVLDGGGHCRAGGW